MRIDIMVLEVRNKLTGDILSCVVVKDMYSEVTVEYPPELITEEDLKARGKEIWGIYPSKTLDTWVEDRVCWRAVNITSEAKDMVSLGNVLVELKEYDVDLEDLIKISKKL